MKIRERELAARVAGCLLLFAFAAAERAPAQTPTFNLSPAVITNNYVGPITLKIGNIASGQEVAVGVFLDANNNGNIDAGEYQVRSFTVTDGAQSILGGATNINVPGDTDGIANGQITTVINYLGLNGTLAGLAGQYLFKLSDPHHVFTSVTNSLTILQAPAAQGVTGTVYANNQPLANAAVILVLQQGNGGAGTVADANGRFSISNAPGVYILIAASPGYVGLPAQLTIASNSFATVNLTNVTATGVLAGTIADSGTGNGIPGLFVPAQGSNALTIGFTDTNGNFALPAIPNQWQFKLDSSSGLASALPAGYVTFQNSKFTTNLVSGSLSNITLSFPRATSLIYGQLTDSRSNALAGVEIDASSVDNLYDGEGETDENGRYAIGVFSNAWYVGPQNLPASYIVENTNVPILNGQSVLQNFQAQLVTAYLIGKVTDGNGVPQAGASLVINAVTSNSLTPVNENFITASDGTFSIGLYAGTWNLAPECGIGSSGLVPPDIYFTLVDGVNQSNILLIEPFATAMISVSIADSAGHPVNATAYAAATINGTNYSPCSYNNNNNVQIAVLPGTWLVGLSGDFTSGGYDNPANQNVTVATNGTVNFVLYPLGQTPPQLANLSRFSGIFELNLTGDPQQSYCIQVSTNLASWKPLVTNTAYGGSFFFDDTNASGPVRFYRAVLEP